MKKEKKEAASFQKLSAHEMQKIDGGIWVSVIQNGKKITVWVPD